MKIYNVSIVNLKHGHKKGLIAFNFYFKKFKYSFSNQTKIIAEKTGMLCKMLLEICFKKLFPKLSTILNSNFKCYN